VVQDPGGETGIVVVLNRLSGKEVQLDVIAGLFLDLSGDVGPVVQIQSLDTFDKDCQVDVAPAVGPTLNL
jgi:hypothetical protein